MSKKLLIILPNWIGDAVMATPLLNHLKSRLQDTELILSGLPHIVSLFNKSSLSQRILPISSQKALGNLTGKIKTIWKKSEIYKKEKIEKVLILPGSISSAIAARLSNIPQRLGYNRDKRNFLLTKSIPHPQDFRTFHRVSYYLRLLQLFPEFNEMTYDRETPESDPLLLEIEPKAKNWATEFLKKNSCSANTVLTIHAGGAYGPSKRWAPNLFCESIIKAFRKLDNKTTQRITCKINPIVMIVGNKDDISNGQHIASTLEKNQIKTIMAAGKTKDVAELTALLERSSLFISNDSGPMHIAAALQLPQIAIFTSTSTNFTRPWNKNSFTFASNIECSPCFKRDCPKLQTKKLSTTTTKTSNLIIPKSLFQCHLSITPDEVAAKIMEML